jgi:hypothetical protein
MSPLEQLFRLEVVFHRRMRTLELGAGETIGLHTSYALQSGYDQLIGDIGVVTKQKIEQLRERLLLEGDGRDVLAACESVRQILGTGLVKSRIRFGGEVRIRWDHERA